ncbi:putative imidazoleglycerol phosphate synthase, cyclase subunit [Leptospira broomii serovar Hurstbridge str. 5399]|uniref:imidazole glycerol-phosphate synthase n=1 Tax=Leptospira broomii serovar Hurstbridge str. 5399 TaxID=1049789 RepID=T0FGE3_9LEPT|nr:imidazole glycerol phosphate synthase cyclase subunit [Leptospira broomii]EQA46667.1 putative imidazoleglycerol phosphate synthase, cyclase subunit [Leptospira broomii serovar Hurstbridge str. 5399]
MLKTRIIPTLLLKNVGIVKGVKFDSWRRVDTILPAIKVYNMREVDELIVVDITATSESRELDYESVAEFSEECFVPLTVGGGIKKITDIRKVLLAGADKVCINSAAFDFPELITEASEKFGSQCIVGSIDFGETEPGKYVCYSHSGKVKVDKDPVEWALTLERLGVGELLVTSVDRDGTMTGYDLTMLRKIADAVKIPVIASGGAGNYGHMLGAIKEGHASAVAAASIFHFTQQTPLEAKKFLEANGIPVRKFRVH